MMNNYGGWQYADSRMMKQNMPKQHMPAPDMMQQNTMPQYMPVPDMIPQYTMPQNMPAPNMMQQHTMPQNMPAPNMMQQHTMPQHMPAPDMMQQNTMPQNMPNTNVMPNKMPPNKIHLDMGSAAAPNQKCKPALSEALELIKKAVEGETEDRMFYDYLIKNASSEEDKKIITEIRDNEIGHAKMFRQLYCDLTGKTLPQNQDVSFEPPATYCEGLIKALIGETNAVKKYRRILFAMTERRHINMLTEIITDEIRHASLYNLLIHNNDCKY